jgi:hypothetical protein
MLRLTAPRAGAAIIVTLTMAACTSRPAGEPARDARTGNVVDSTRRSALTPSGDSVTVIWPAFPIVEGGHTLRLAISGAARLASSLSVDIASPEMPSHGVLRFPVTRDSSGTLSAAIDVPMVGLWALYVNAGSDANAAEFMFVAQGKDSVSTHSHGSSGPATHGGSHDR